ncbi:MAG: oligopeptide/dipeptide ABC transporter ATP-binding protein, partial [Burkholderiales bacterium]
MSQDAPLLRVRDLKTWLATGDAIVRAVDGVSFDVQRGETFALVGESGCGKSMTALSIMRLLPDAGGVVGGSVELDGSDLLQLPESRMRDVRGRRVGMIFQEPALSLNPVMTAGEQIAEAIRRHSRLTGVALEARVLELIEAVRVPDAARRCHEYPFQLSGGMMQRVMIAMALACEPELLIADEPTTALDVTIQAQVLDLLRELQTSRRMSLMLITHDLGVVAEMAHRVAVMYAGEIVETASRAAFFSRPAHPYSRKLFDSLPAGNKRDAPLAVIRGTVPSLTRNFTGCRFADRCDSAWDLCRTSTPGFHDAGNGQFARCHLFAPGADKSKVESRKSKVESETGGNEALSPSIFRLPPSDARPLLDAKGLKVHFPVHRGLFKRVVAHVRAVDGVTLAIEAGRTLGLVGESGCGKTTVGKGILRLVEPTAGTVLFDG